MSYLIQARLAGDPDLLARVTACAATQGVLEPGSWAHQYRWELSAMPGWVDAYTAAVDLDSDRPGAVEAGITDQVILDAVQSLRGVVDDEAE